VHCWTLSHDVEVYIKDAGCDNDGEHRRLSEEHGFVKMLSHWKSAVDQVVEWRQWHHGSPAATSK